MNLSDKTKAEFEKWFLEKYISIMDNQMVYAPDTVLTIFYEKQLAEKIGVLTLYFDSVGIYIGVYPIDVFENRCDGYGYEIVQYKKETIDDDTLLSRQQAWTQAVAKASEIREEQLNK